MSHNYKPFRFVALEICQMCITDPFGNEIEDWEDPNMCDCCCKGWDFENEQGWCQCYCSDCHEPLSDCKYSCQLVIE